MKYLNITIVIFLCSFAPVSCMVGMHPRVGWFPESSFKLAKESGLPKWFSSTEELNRNDVNIELFYYAPPPLFKENVKALLIGPGPEYEILDKKFGISRDHPLSARNPNSPNYYPSYNIVIIDGVEEIVEHKKMEPIYYITNKFNK